MTLGGAEQLAAAHYPNERTLDPQSAAITDPPMLQPATLWPSPRNVQTVNRCYATYVYIDGRKSEAAGRH